MDGSLGAVVDPPSVFQMSLEQMSLEEMSFEEKSCHPFSFFIRGVKIRLKWTSAAFETQSLSDHSKVGQET